MWYADAWRTQATDLSPHSRRGHLLRSATLQEREAELIEQSHACIEESLLLLRRVDRVLAK
jgi:hypothetical protein